MHFTIRFCWSLPNWCKVPNRNRGIVEQCISMMCYLIHHAVINRKTKMKRRKRYQEMRLKFQFLVDKGPSSHHVTKSQSKVGSEDTLLMEYMFWLHIHLICMMYPKNPIYLFFLDYTYITNIQPKEDISTRNCYDDWRCQMVIEHKIEIDAYMYNSVLAEYDNNVHNNWFPIFISCMCHVHTSNYII